MTNLFKSGNSTGKKYGENKQKYKKKPFFSERF